MEFYMYLYRMSCISMEYYLYLYRMSCISEYDLYVYGYLWKGICTSMESNICQNKTLVYAYIYGIISIWNLVPF